MTDNDQIDLSKLSREELEENYRVSLKRTGLLEIELETLTEKFRQMFDRHSSMRIVLDPGNQGQIVDANHAACVFYGYDHRSLTGMTIFDISKSSDNDVKKFIKSALSGDTNQFQFQHKISDGTTREVEVYASPVEIKGSRLLFSIIHDITARVNAERSLKESEERFRLLSDVTFEGVIVTTDGNISDVNSTATLMFGYAHNEFVKHDLRSLTVNGYPGLLYDDVSLSEATLPSPPVETLCIKKNGSVFHAEVREKTVQKNNRSLRIIAVRDISERYAFQAALDFSEKRYRTMIDTSSEGFWLLDSDGKTVDVNESLCELIGHPRKDLIGKSPNEFIAGSDLSIVAYGFSWDENSSRRNYEVDLIHRDGRTIPVIMHATSLRDASGGFAGAFAFVADVSIIKDSEKQIQENLILLQAIIDGIPAPMYYRDSEGKYLGVNRSFEEFFGVTRGEITGKSLGEMFSKDMEERLGAYFNDVLNHQRSVHYEATLTGSEGYTRDFLIFKSPYHHGKMRGVVGVALDITEQKIIEEQIKILNEHLEVRVEEEIASRLASESKYEFIFNSSADAMLIYELQDDTSPGKILEANNRAIDLLGISRERITSMSVSDFESPDTIPVIKSFLDQLREDGYVVYESEMKDSSGKYIPVEVNLSLFLFQKRTTVLAGIRDITERKALEYEKTVQSEMLIQQSKLAELGEMVGAIAHQWKQPLNIIGMIVQDLEEAWHVGEVDESFLNEFVKSTMYQIKFLIQTIDDFRRFFKSDHEEAFFRLEIAVRDIVRLLSSQMRNHGIEVHITEHFEGDIKVFGPANELKQVILNLLNNSRDAIHQKREDAGPRYHGEIWLKILKEGEFAILEICDNGGGIPDEILPELFRAYVTSKGTKGTGIGLYMSKNIIERSLHGTITAWNGIAGACFQIRLRLRLTGGS